MGTISQYFFCQCYYRNLGPEASKGMGQSNFYLSIEILTEEKKSACLLFLKWWISLEL